ncbi:hypothetical protein TWF569_001729 [Orbilia oligospora]|uniref:Nuclear segregation protein Bfr1 n=1 Tax=Orbilia oligospora TaxID=2813651 RepID=A0A7C8JAG2_ORBOL|nr:hypothetical protein TWF103_000790 [Orbilia oligospora]KAF3100327.1 hypothetical protein TWF102_005213 [Orbilia oligospora]KAF3111782.1 hypothetical protein TWF706_011512 [Orbilia oligospora]KAF3123482.1 hypothetical protein TWF569_001729 [Orbilia oligospora]KAF3140125.1 hypothetical protein TWF594_006513 [Orbilia oligospora]
MADAAVERKVKPEKPDEAKYQTELAQLQKEHEAMMKQLNEVKAKLDLSKPAGANGAQNPAQQRQSTLRKELGEIRATQSTKKSSRQDLLNRQKTLNDSINNKIAAQRAARAKISFKSPEEIDTEIRKLEGQVDSGNLKLVDERRTLDQISNLRKLKKNFAGFDEEQGAIDKLKASLADIRSQLDDPEAKALSDRFTEITKELDSIKAEQDGVFQNLNSLRDERTRLQKEQQEKFGEIKALKDAYYGAKNAFREYEQEAWKVRKEKQRAEREAYEKKKKMEVANQLLEEASFKAFTSEIHTCENLIAFFDPESAPKKADGPVSQYKASIGRTITEEPKGMKVLKKDEEDYFIGGNSKKKGKKNKAAGSEAPTPAKFSLSIGILDELSKVEVSAPTGAEDVPSVVEKLKAKLQHYKENQERVTQENIVKAKARIEELEKFDRLEDAVGDLSVADGKAE